MKETLLELNRINKSFDKVKVVDSVSFKVYEGEVFGLLGPNGAGKTTLIRMIMDIIKPDDGKILFKGEQILDKTKVGYLPEERGIYTDTRVIDTIMFFAGLKGMEKAQAKEQALFWLKELGLSEYANSKIEQLSKGMQQKIQFIIAIVHKPQLLILDEVFSGLDPVNQELFKKIIKQLAESGITILLSSHRMNLVEELCDRIFMINHGQQVLYGEINKIKDDIGEKKVALAIKGSIDYLKNNTYIRNLKFNKNIVEFTLHKDIKPVEFLTSLPKDIIIEEVSILKPPLHDIFVHEAERRQKT